MLNTGVGTGSTHSHCCRKTSFELDRTPTRKLRIGYVSPDFRQHAVALFAEPLLANHYRAEVDLHCYSEVAAPDAVTERFRALADHWHSTVIQLPEDMICIQEVIWRLQPDVIVETGVAHGGSLIFYASLFEAMGHGRVIGVDIDIREHNRTAIEAHPLATRNTLIQGSSTAPGTLADVRRRIAPDESVLVVHDSNHSRAHVEAELDFYAPLVSPGSYIVACDGIMAQVAGAPRTAPDWTWNNPLAAIAAFLARNPNFGLEEPGFAFNEGVVRNRVTYGPKSYLRRRS